MNSQQFNRMMRNCAAATLLALSMMLSSEKSYAQKVATDTTVYNSVETLPQFPGGIKGFTEYVRTNLRYPAEAQKQKVEGRVNVSFVVERDGKVSGVKAVGRPILLLQEEAIRIIRSSPRWSAGIQSGKAVRTQFTVPIMFALKG